MKKTTRAAALFALLLLLPALSLAADFAVVRGGRLNLRAQASSASRSLGLYGTGSWVQVNGSAGGGWYAVTTMDGRQGYMAGNYLNFGANANQATVRYANGGYVNLRSAPSMDASVLMQVTCGMAVTVQSHSGDWDYITVPSGIGPVSGYMLRSFLESETPAAVVMTRNGGKVNVRSGPSPRYGSVGSLASGTSLTVTLKGNGWYRITGGGLTGFMSTSYISGSGATVGSNTGWGGGTTASQVAYVNNPRSTQVLNLRDAPSQSARSIGQYRNGVQVKVVAYGPTWCEVYVGTRHGYMMTRYLVFTTNPYTIQNEQPVPIATVAPVVAATPMPTVQMPLPVVQSSQPAQSAQSAPSGGAPTAGQQVTLAVQVGEANAVNVYADSSAGTLLSAVPSGTKATLLTYGPNTCMVLLTTGQVGHVYTRYVAF